MKYNFDLELSFRPRFKCGAVIGPAIGGLFGLFGAESTANTNAWLTMRENQKNRDFNREEAQKQRDWQEEQWNYQFAKQAAEWYNQQNYQKDVNSPKAQVQRLQEAGINPAAALSQINSGGLSFAGSVPSPSPQGAVAPSPVTTPVVSPTNEADAFSHIASSIGSLIGNLSKAGRDNAEADKTRSTLGLIIQNLAADVKGKELMNTYQDMFNFWYDKKAPKEFEKIGKEIDELSAKIILADTQNELLDQQVITEQFRQLLLSHQDELTVEQLLQAKVMTDKYGALLTSQINANNSSANYNNAAARAQPILAEAARDQAKAAIRNSLKQNGIFFPDTPEGRAQENAFIESTLDEMEANTYVPETESVSGSFGAGILSTGGKGSSSRSTTTQKKVYNRYRAGHKRSD